MSNKFRTIVVDDERNAVDFIVSIIGEYCPQLKVVGTAGNVDEAINIVGKESPDLLFLDVDMPNGTGFDLLRHFPEKEFDVIFITAFNHYAIQAIRFSAVDYILKPINISEFTEAVERVIKKRSDASGSQNEKFRILMENLKTPTPSRLVIPTSDGLEYLNPREIILIEADRSYSLFYLSGERKILVSKNLKEFQDLLGERNFFRPHNSYLINLRFVKKYVKRDGGYIEMSNGAQVPVSRNRKEIFQIHMARFRG